MTTNNKAVKIKILLLARSRIQISANFGICAAISDSAMRTDEIVAGSQLRDYIGHSLGGSLFLPGWIRVNRKDYVLTIASARRARLQYIDWMVACLSEDIAKEAKRKKK